MSFNGQALPRRPKPTESQLLQWLSKSKAPQSQPEGFRAGRAPGPNDVFIAVMGVTGSGKSSFISLCSGKSVKIGHDLQSCTSVVAIYAYDISPDRTVYLIDTPGFDDTTRSDTEVLSEIAAWLADSYRNKILLHGIIYLHRITDNRMQGSAKRNFMMFKQLCGPAALKSVILVTTMWDRVGEREGAEREKVLIDTEEFWGWMVSKGSSFHRHDNTGSCARDIISLLANRDGPVATELQRQLVDENRSLDQTSAGRELEAEMLKEKEKWEKERKDMEERMTTAIQQRDREAEELLREERDRYTAKIKKVEGDTEKLRATMKNLIADRDKRVARMEKELEEQKAAHKEQLRRFEKRKKQLKEEKEEIERRNAYDMRKEFSLVKQAAQQLEEERKRLEKERDQVRKEKVQAQQAEQRPPHPGTLAVKAHQSHSKAPTTYSVSMCGNMLIFSRTACCWSSNQVVFPKMKAGSAWLEAASLGSYDSQGTQWIARYRDGTWSRSALLEASYPHLGCGIRALGVSDLEFCVLGPRPDFYARWKGGECYYHARDNVRTQLAAIDGSKIAAVAFGYGGAFIMSYGFGPETLSYWYNLRGYYPYLDQFMQSHWPVRILAVTLDPLSPTDFVMVYFETLHSGATVAQIVWYSSDQATSAAILNWWQCQRGCAV